MPQKPWLEMRTLQENLWKAIWVIAMAKGQLKRELRLRIIKGIEAFTNYLSLPKGIQKEINLKNKKSTIYGYLILFQ